MSALPEPVLARRTARALTEEVKRDIVSLREKLLRLFEGNAHIALGYSSWAAYWSAEFETSWQTGYRQLDAARVERVLAPVRQLENGSLRESHARALVPLLNDEPQLLDAYRELREEYGDAVTAERIRTVVGARLQGERQTGYFLSSTSQEWYTPPEYIEAARVVMGQIDLDPASSRLANKTVGARRIYTAQDDGLTKRWRGKVWCNPPYGSAPERRGSYAALFANKLLYHHERGDVPEAIMLLNGYRVDARWFEPLWDYPLCFATGARLPFLNPHREDGGNFRPSITPVLPYLGRNFDAFYEAFSPLGKIVKDPSGREWQKRWSRPPSPSAN